MSEHHNPGEFYWIIARDPETGRPYLLPGGTTEDQARQKGLELLAGVDFKLRRLPTTDIRRASQLFKGQRLEKTKSLKKAVERVGHAKSLESRRKKMGGFE